MGHELLLTIAQVSERLSMGRSVIYQLLLRGDLRSVHIGRSRRVLVSDLEAFVGSLRDADDGVQTPA